LLGSSVRSGPGTRVESFLRRAIQAHPWLRSRESSLYRRQRRKQCKLHGHFEHDPHHDFMSCTVNKRFEEVDSVWSRSRRGHVKLPHVVRADVDCFGLRALMPLAAELWWKLVPDFRMPERVLERWTTPDELRSLVWDSRLGEHPNVPSIVLEYAAFLPPGDEIARTVINEMWTVWRKLQTKWYWHTKLTLGEEEYDEILHSKDLTILGRRGQRQFVYTKWMVHCFQRRLRKKSARRKVGDIDEKKKLADFDKTWALNRVETFMHRCLEKIATGNRILELLRRFDAFDIDEEYYCCTLNRLIGIDQRLASRAMALNRRKTSKFLRKHVMPANLRAFRTFFMREARPVVVEYEEEETTIKEAARERFTRKLKGKAHTRGERQGRRKRGVPRPRKDLRGRKNGRCRRKIDTQLD